VIDWQTRKLGANLEDVNKEFGLSSPNNIDSLLLCILPILATVLLMQCCSFVWHIKPKTYEVAERVEDHRDLLGNTQHAISFSDLGLLHMHTKMILEMPCCKSCITIRYASRQWRKLPIIGKHRLLHRTVRRAACDIGIINYIRYQSYLGIN